MLGECLVLVGYTAVLSAPIRRSAAWLHRLVCPVRGPSVEGWYALARNARTPLPIVPLTLPPDPACPRPSILQVTIDDCTHVIDAGRVREMRYDPITRMSCLVEVWISKVSEH